MNEYLPRHVEGDGQVLSRTTTVTTPGHETDTDDKACQLLLNL